MRLFTERGYDATSVKQIAEAPEVSPSIFYCFPTKGAMVLYDTIDLMITDKCMSQPHKFNARQALRKAF